MSKESIDRTKGGQFAGGTSGNPKGRPRGSWNQFNDRLRELAEAHGPELIEAAFRKAHKGDDKALQFCGRFLLRFSNGQSPLQLDLPEIRAVRDLEPAYGTAFEALREGTLTVGDVEQIAQFLESYSKTMALLEWEQRIAACEASAEAIKLSHQKFLAIGKEYNKLKAQQNGVDDATHKTAG